MTISAGTSGSQALITIPDDTIVENRENFELQLSAPSPIGTISATFGSATGFIDDNDGMRLMVIRS